MYQPTRVMAQALSLVAAGFLTVGFLLADMPDPDTQPDSLPAGVSAVNTNVVFTEEGLTNAIALDPEGTPLPGTTNVFLDWDVHWDEGLRYKFGHRNLLYIDDPRIYSSRRREIEGLVAFRLQIDAAAYDAERGLGEIDNGAQIRRARLYTTGSTFLLFPMSYKIEAEVADGKFFFREDYAWFQDMPIIQSIKLGHFKAPSTFEDLVSSRDRAFMETASPIEAFAQDIRLGVQPAGVGAQERVTWAAGWFGDGDDSDVGDASESVTRLIGRVSWLPYASESSDEPELVHLGASGSYVYSGKNTVRYRSRPESYLAPRLVDTGDILARGALLYGLEAVATRGPWTLQSEYLHSTVNEDGGDDLEFRGIYVQGSVFLTGENRAYNRQRGIFVRVRPDHKLAPRKGQWGTWETALRYSYLDLNDGDVEGGIMTIAMAGLNCYYSSTMRIMFNVGYADVRDGPVDGSMVLGQTRLQLQF